MVVFRLHGQTVCIVIELYTIFREIIREMINSNQDWSGDWPDPHVNIGVGVTVNGADEKS